MSDYTTTKLTDKFVAAVREANLWHANQTRKGGVLKVPYLCHLLQVAGIVIEYGGTEDQAIAALLHDSIEDVNITYEDIRLRFGTHVANIVQACTHQKIDKSRPKEEWPALIKEKRIQVFEEFRKAEEGVLRVASADKLHNMRSLLKDLRQQGIKAWDAFKGGREGTLFYFENLIKIFRECSVPAVQEIGKEMLDILTILQQRY